jgi:hypothetical protein
MLSDLEFERQIALARIARRAYAEGVAYERQMYTATAGISHRRALEASPEGVRQSLIASYASAGMTQAQITERLDELRLAAMPWATRKATRR